MAGPQPHVTVVGAGFLGSSIARHLAQGSSDVKVTVLEAAARPASGATGRSWAWLNANRKKPESYRDLNYQSMKEWQALRHKGISEFPGTLTIADSRTKSSPGYPFTVVPSGEVHDLEPSLARDVGAACLYSQEGFAYPLDATEAFLADARSVGAEVQFCTEVHSFERAGHRVTGVVTSKGTLCTDCVVLAAGLATPKLASMAGVPDGDVQLAPRDATLNVHTTQLPPLLRHMLVTDTIFLRQARDGSVLISPFHKPPGLPTDADEPALCKAGSQVLQDAAAVVPGLRGAGVASTTLTQYPCPADGHPIIGFTSGATLAPLIGRLVAEEVIESLVSSAAHAGEQNISGRSAQQWLTEYRPGRSFADTSYVY